MMPRTPVELRRECAWVDAAVATIAEQLTAPVNRAQVLARLLDDVHVSQRRRRLKLVANALLKREPIARYHPWSVAALQEAEHYPGRAAPALLTAAIEYLLQLHPNGLDAEMLGEMLLEDPIVVEAACRALAQEGVVDGVGPRWYAAAAVATV